MVMFAGILPALRDLAPARRGPVVARLVNGFSPLALFGAGLLAAMGVITAWTHLKRLDALWTTPYGWALIAKLCVVATVVGFGALNWRKQKPKLGDEAGALSIRGSATIELVLGGVVLLITSVLVSLPSPR
jgi:putative copper export protein